MDTPEMRQVTVEIELFSYNGVSGSLLQIQASVGDQVTSCQKVGQFASNVTRYFNHDARKVFV
jgi:hypothetical protein